VIVCCRFCTEYCHLRYIGRVSCHHARHTV